MKIARKGKNVLTIIPSFIPSWSGERLRLFAKTSAVLFCDAKSAINPTS